MIMETTVVGIFDGERAADDAIRQLIGNGFGADRISALVPRTEGGEVTLEPETRATEGAVYGASTGAVAGGVLATMVGVGVITVPGLGLLIAAGPVIAALTGIAAGGTLGGITGAVVGLGVPEAEAERYETHIRAGGLLVMVHVDGPAELRNAELILRACDAREVAAIGELSRAEGTAAYTDPPTF